MRLVGRMLAPRCIPAPNAAAHARCDRIGARLTTASASLGEKELVTVASWRLALLQASSSNRPVSSDFSMAIRLKGVTFDNKQELIQQLQPGEGVLFCREPSNPADPFAVGVYTASMQQLGYVPRHAAQSWKLQTCFGRVVAVGQVSGGGPWGATVECKPSIQGICLDLLPDSWQQQANMEQALGQQEWADVQQRVLQQYGNRCAISSMPAQQLPQPLRVVPQWRFDYIKKQVHLAQLVPICEPLLQLQQQLSTAAEQLASSATGLQRVSGAAGAAAAAAAAAATAAAAAPRQGVSSTDCTSMVSSKYAAVHQLHGDATAAAVAALPAEQQAAVRWLSTLTPWPQQDCVEYMAYAGWRRQQQLTQEGWQFVRPDPLQVAALLPKSSSKSAAVTGAGGVGSKGTPLPTGKRLHISRPGLRRPLGPAAGR